VHHHTGHSLSLSLYFSSSRKNLMNSESLRLHWLTQKCVLPFHLAHYPALAYSTVSTTRQLSLREPGVSIFLVYLLAPWLAYSRQINLWRKSHTMNGCIDE
jgi:hypothetical protein